jgi:hypothetical protein
MIQEICEWVYAKFLFINEELKRAENQVDSQEELIQEQEKRIVEMQEELDSLRERIFGDQKAAKGRQGEDASRVYF